MSWRDRATKIESTSQEPSKSSWRDRATKVEETPKEEGMLDRFNREEQEKKDRQDALEKKYSKTSSAIKGGVQGATLGFSDEIGAGISAGLDKTQAFFNKLGLAGKSPSQVAEELRKKGFTGDLGPETLADIYNKSLEENRQELKDAEEANPGSYLTGNLAGSVLPALIPGAASVKGAAALGAAAGVGSGNADNLGDAALDAGIGGLAGGALTKYLPAVTEKIGSKATSMLDDLAETQAVKNLGFGKKAMESLSEDSLNNAGKSQMNDLGRYILDNDLLKYGKGRQAKALYNEIDEVGKTLGDTYSKVGDIDMDQAFRNIMSKSKLDAPDLYTKEVNKMAGQVDDLLAQPTRSSKDVRSTISSLDDKIYSLATSEEKAGQSAAKGARQALDEAFNSKAAKDLGEEGFNKMTQDQYNYGLLKRGEKLADNQVGADASNKFFGLGNLASMGIGGMTGGVPGLVGGVAMNQAKNQFGNAAIAQGANKASQIIKNIGNIPGLKKYAPALTGAAQRGVDAQNATHWTLYNTDPEYRKAFNEEQDRKD